MRPGGRSDADPLTGRPCLSAGRKDRPARMKAVHALQYRCRVKGIRDVSREMPGLGVWKQQKSPEWAPQRNSRRSMDAPSRPGTADEQKIRYSTALPR